MSDHISIGIEMVEGIKKNEEEAQIPWETLTEANALSTVSRATNLLNAGVVGYVRMTSQMEIEWTHLYILSPSSCPTSRVQFRSDPVVATHWVAVEVPIKNDEKPTYITIRDGQRFFIDPNERFLVIECTDWYSSINGPTYGETPQTKYEFYIPDTK